MYGVTEEQIVTKQSGDDYSNPFLRLGEHSPPGWGLGHQQHGAEHGGGGGVGGSVICCALSGRYI